MAPTYSARELKLHTIRDYCASGDPNCLATDSPWYTFGRWILLAIIVGLAIIIFIAFSFISARRRKRMGDNPLPLTGWAHRPNKSQWEQGYVNQGQPHQQQNGAVNGDETWPGAAPPAYNQTMGVTQPEAAHTTAGENGQQYAPPAGPPPSDGKI